MIRICNILIALLLIFYFSCTINKEGNIIEEISTAKMDSVERRNVYEKIEYFVNVYDAKEDERLRLERLVNNYSIDDSLCFYMAKLDKRELIEDDYFRYLMGKLLEKKYLGVRNYGKFDPDFFAVYNASILYDDRMSNGFALKMVIGEKFNIDSTFSVYAYPWREFLCIDSVVLVLDKLPQMQNDSNHQKCMYLVKNNKTGGCKW